MPGTRDSDSPDSYAQDRISEYGHAAADRAVIDSGSIGESAARQIRAKNISFYGTLTPWQFRTKQKKSGVMHE